MLNGALLKLLQYGFMVWHTISILAGHIFEEIRSNSRCFTINSISQLLNFQLGTIRQLNFSVISN